MSLFKESLIINLFLTIADTKYHTSISKWYHQIRRMEQWSPAKIKEWQIKNMHDRINHAYHHIPYYKQLFDRLHLRPEDIQTLEDLEKIPVLTKELIRDNYDLLIPDDIERYYYHQDTTGGSTGNPLKYLADYNSWGFVNAYSIHCWKQTGYYYGDKFIALGGSSIGVKKKKSLPHKWFYFLKGKISMGSSNMNEPELERYASYIINHRIHYIYGYASSIFLLAKYVQEHDLKSQMDIRAVYPTSDILTELYIEAIQNAFGCVIIDSYGAHDGFVIAYKKIGEDGFKAGYNSIIQVDNSIRENYGNIILTDILGYSFPFIRYTLGDIVELDPKNSYSEFHNGQVVKKVLGRNSDIIKLKNDYYISGISLTNVFKDLNIMGYRVEVASDNEIKILIVPNRFFTQEEEAKMIEVLKERTGHGYSITVVHVDYLQQRENGKSLFLMV